MCPGRELGVEQEVLGQLACRHAQRLNFPPVVEAWGRRSGESAEAVALPPGVMERHGVRGASVRIWGRQAGLHDFLRGSGG